MDHVFRSGFVQFLSGHSELRCGRIEISRSHSGAYLLDLGSQGAAESLVKDTEFFVLSKALFGGGCIWHGSIEIAALAGEDGSEIRRKFEPQSMATPRATVQS